MRRTAQSAVATRRMLFFINDCDFPSCAPPVLVLVVVVVVANNQGFIPELTRVGCPMVEPSLSATTTTTTSCANKCHTVSHGSCDHQQHSPRATSLSQPVVGGVFALQVGYLRGVETPSALLFRVYGENGLFFFGAVVGTQHNCQPK